MPRTQTSKGFTIVELAIATPIVIIVMVVILGFLVSLLTDFSDQRIKQVLNVNGQTALSQIEADVKLSSEFLMKTDTTVFKDTYGQTRQDTANPSGVDWDIEGAGSTSRVLILSTYATTQNPIQITRAPVYLDTYGCSGESKYTNDVLRNTTIYFVRNNDLYRRVLTDTNSTTCDPPFQKQSCPTPSGSTARYTATPPETLGTCIASDVEVLNNVTSFNITYYANADDDSSSPINPYGLSPENPSALSMAMSADISITHSDKAGSNNTDTAILRVTRMN